MGGCVRHNFKARCLHGLGCGAPFRGRQRPPRTRSGTPGSPRSRSSPRQPWASRPVRRSVGALKPCQRGQRIRDKRDGRRSAEQSMRRRTLTSRTTDTQASSDSEGSHLTSCASCVGTFLFAFVAIADRAADAPTLGSHAPLSHSISEHGATDAREHDAEDLRVGVLSRGQRVYLGGGRAGTAWVSRSPRQSAGRAPLVRAWRGTALAGPQCQWHAS